MAEVGRRFVPVRQNSAEREKLEETLVKRGPWPRLAKGCLPNTMAHLAFFEKLGKFQAEAAEYSLTVTALYAATDQGGHARPSCALTTGRVEKRASRRGRACARWQRVGKRG
jgi:hypothetical protein